MKVLSNTPRGKCVGKPILLCFNVMGERCENGFPKPDALQEEALIALENRAANSTHLKNANAVLFGEHSSNFHNGFPQTVKFALVVMAAQLYKI